MKYIGQVFLIILLMSCSNSKRIDSNIDTIVGEWTVQEAKFIGEYEDMIAASNEKMNLYTFLGSSIWLNAEGESFIFETDGSWNSTMIPIELRDKIQLNYQYNDKIFMNTIMLLDDRKFEFEVDVIEKKSDFMVWKFGNYMDVTLKKRSSF